MGVCDADDNETPAIWMMSLGVSASTDNVAPGRKAGMPNGRNELDIGRSCMRFAGWGGDDLNIKLHGDSESPSIDGPEEYAVDMGQLQLQ